MKREQTIRILIFLGVGLVLIAGVLIGGYYYLQNQTPAKSSSQNNTNSSANKNVQIITPKTESPLQAGEKGPGTVPIQKTQ